MVEFALVSVLALTVALALVQLALFLYQRNVVMTAVSEGARVAASAGRGPEAGRTAACELIEQAVGDRCERLHVTATEQGDLVVLVATGTLPSFVPAVPDLPLHIEARMHDEEQLVEVPA